MQLILVLFWFKPAVKKKKKRIRVFPRLQTQRNSGTHRDNFVLILEKKSSPNFPRRNSDHSRKRAAAPGDDDPPPAVLL